MSNSIEKTVEESVIKIVGSSNICSSYDDECVYVEDPFYCWLGFKCGIADGLCPMIHKEN